MNNISLYQINKTNQASSWTDDPFNLKGTIAGVANLNHEQLLFNYIDDCVSQYAKWINDGRQLFLSDLPEIEQNELARLYLEYTNRDTSECVYGDDFSINSDYICALLAMLKDDCQETRNKFAETTRKNVLNYYAQSLQSLIDIACDDSLRNAMNEEGYYSHRDMDHGDVHWSRR
jgi:hypothetical protein